MIFSTTLVLRLLAAVIIVLVSTLAAAAAMSMSRHDGDRWTSAIRNGAKTFAATLTVLSIVYGIVAVAS